MFWISFLNWIEQVGSWLLVGVSIGALIVIAVLIVKFVPEKIPATILGSSLKSVGRA